MKQFKVADRIKKTSVAINCFRCISLLFFCLSLWQCVTVTKTQLQCDTSQSELNAFHPNLSAACHVPVTCCCSSGTTPPSSCYPPSLCPSLLLRRARRRDVPVHPPPPLPEDPIFHPEWTGCLCRWVVPVWQGGDPNSHNSVYQCLFPHRTLLNNNDANATVMQKCKISCVLMKGRKLLTDVAFGIFIVNLTVLHFKWEYSAFQMEGGKAPKLKSGFWCDLMSSQKSRLLSYLTYFHWVKSSFVSH